MADFELAYPKTIRHENGGVKNLYKCDEDDNGDWSGGKKNIGALVGTIDGITAAEVMAALGKTHATITKDDVRYFPESKRKPIYKKKYWDGVLGDRIDDQQIAEKIYDEEVNAGNASIKQAQQIAGLPVTGKMSEATLQYINNPV
ncbi:MAG: glycosyl hydrolase 108 family protein [Bacteroidota bacterium]